MMTNLFTIDLEDWYQTQNLADAIPATNWDRMPSHLEQAAERLFALVEGAGIRATVFVPGWNALRHPALISGIAGRSHQIGFHGHMHELIGTLTPTAFRAMVHDGRARLEDITGCPVEAYRAPSWSLTHDTWWALDILAEEGYRFDSSLFLAPHSYGGLSGYAHARPHAVAPTGILEFPVAAIPLFCLRLPFAGGGFFRLWPYRLVRWAFRHLNGNGMPVVFYIHPWEIDPLQPRVAGGATAALRRFKHYVGLTRTERKLQWLLRDMSFTSLREYPYPQ